jgi:hypothetical protein
MEYIILIKKNRKFTMEYYAFKRQDTTIWLNVENTYGLDFYH